jgi:hypothetical protein
VAPLVRVGMVTPGSERLPVLGGTGQPAAQPLLKRINGLGTARRGDLATNQPPVEVEIGLRDDRTPRCGIAASDESYPGEQDRLRGVVEHRFDL